MVPPLLATLQKVLSAAADAAAAASMQFTLSLSLSPSLPPSLSLSPSLPNSRELIQSADAVVAHQNSVPTLPLPLLEEGKVTVALSKEHVSSGVTRK